MRRSSGGLNGPCVLTDRQSPERPRSGCRRPVWCRHEKGRIAAALSVTRSGGQDSALAGLETRVGLADHENLATTANHLAVAVTGLRRLQGGQDLHGKPRQETVGRGPESVGQNLLALYVLGLSSRAF